MFISLNLSVIRSLLGLPRGPPAQHLPRSAPFSSGWYVYRGRRETGSLIPSLLTFQAWIWRHPPITCRPRLTYASSKSLTTRTSSLSFPTSWRRIVSENRGFSRSPPGSLGTWHSSTLHEVPTHLRHLSLGTTSCPTWRSWMNLHLDS